MGYETGVSPNDLTKLTHVSRSLDERLNRAPNRNAPYVGESAFAHKGGLHVSAVEKDPRCYEHIAPELVGNRRHIVVSDQAGRSNILARFREIGLDVEPSDPRLVQLVEEVKLREYNGYAYDGAEASFELLARRILAGLPEFFRLHSFRVVDERRWNGKNELVTLFGSDDQGRSQRRAFHGRGRGERAGERPRRGIAQGLTPTYPQFADLRLVDYKVRILNPKAGTGAVDPGDDRKCRPSGRTMVDGRRVDQRHRRVVQRLARQHHLQIDARRHRRGMRG